MSPRHTLTPDPILQPYMVQRERYRLQRLLTPRWLQLTLPHRDAMPSHFRQLAQLFLIPLLVPAYLRHPELAVRLRNLATLRTLKVKSKFFTFHF